MAVYSLLCMIIIILLNPFVLSLFEGPTSYCAPCLAFNKYHAGKMRFFFIFVVVEQDNANEYKRNE